MPNTPKPRDLRAWTLAIATLTVATAAAPRVALGEPAPATPAGPAAPAAPATIDKTPRFEIRDRGEAVEVIAHNIKAARTAIIPIRSRLNVPIVGLPLAKRMIPSDATVKLIELDGEDSIRVLSVKLGFERADVKALSRFAQAIQVGDDLHILVPRKLPADGLSPKLPGPSLPPELAAVVAKIDQAAAPQIGPRPDPSAVHKPEPKLEAKAEPKLEAKAEPKLELKTDAKLDAKADAKLGPLPAPVEPTPAARREPAADAASALSTPIGLTAEPLKPATRRGDPKSLKQALASEGDDSWSKVSMYGAIGLAAAGGGIWLMRRRRTQPPVTSSIDVLAQRSLGGKARILLLSVGPRELLVAVTGQQVSLLGQWAKTDVASAVPAAVSFAAVSQAHAAAHAAQTAQGFGPRFDAPGDIREPREKPVSPAVSGILRLRARTGQMPISEAVATGDVEADELWAKEILAATGARS
jgi:flagellar biogenesis protein FliO